MVIGLPNTLVRDGLTDGDFEETYTVDSLLSGATHLDSLAVVFGEPEQKLRTTSRDCEYTAVVQSSDESEWCMECTRSLLHMRQLVSRPGMRGRVAYRNLMQVHPQYRERGIATAIVQKEERQIFRKWVAVEIQALAALDGPKVWPKAHFGYEAFPDQLMLLKITYDFDWGKGNVNSSQINSISDFPDDFWEYFSGSGRQFEIYKVLTREQQ